MDKVDVITKKIILEEDAEDAQSEKAMTNSKWVQKERNVSA